jgi:hypothetical protein
MKTRSNPLFPGFSMKARKQYNYIGSAGFESSNMGPFIYEIKYNEIVGYEFSLSSRFDKS